MNQKAKYSIIENDIIEKITQNVYRPDMQLPTEEELRKQYGCSRVTVRRALSDLQYMGYIYFQAGKRKFYFFEAETPVSRQGFFSIRVLS